MTNKPDFQQKLIETLNKDSAFFDYISNIPVEQKEKLPMLRRHSLILDKKATFGLSLIVIRTKKPKSKSKVTRDH